MRKVIDDLLPTEEYLALLKLAFRVPYANFPFGGHHYPGLALTDDAHVFAAIEQHLQKTVIPVTTYFRRGQHKDPHETYIHTDEGLGTHAGIFYLTDGQAGEGTAFWKHRLTGAENRDPVAAMDGMDESKWTLTQLVQSKRNRLLLFPTDAFHSRYPFQPLSGMRLVQTAFFTIKE